MREDIDMNTPLVPSGWRERPVLACVAHRRRLAIRRDAIHMDIAGKALSNAGWMKR